MTRRIQRLLALATTGCAIGAAAPAIAQHYHGSGHYDYHPGHYDYHDGHYDYHPGHYDSHPDHHGPVYVQPRPSYVVPRQPTYVPPGNYDRTGHSHEHAGPSFPTRPIMYGDFSHIDDLAIELENRANALCLELHYNYQHNPGYGETYREAYEILTTAKYIHGLEHAGNRDKIRQAVGELDRLFHHVQSDVVRWTGHHHRPVGHGGLTAKLENIEETLHHFMDDVGAHPSSTPRPEQAPPAGGAPSYQGTPSYQDVPNLPRGNPTPIDGSAIGPPPGGAPSFGSGPNVPFGAAPRFNNGSGMPQGDTSPPMTEHGHQHLENGSSVPQSDTTPIDGSSIGSPPDLPADFPN